MPTGRVFCTSFSPDGYERYGKRCLESFAEHCGDPIYVFYEGRKPDLKGPHYVDILEDLDLRDFLATYNTPAARGIIGLKDGHLVADYKWQCVRFCYKVFSQRHFPKTDWWIWIDADTVLNKDLDKRFFDTVCPAKGLISYLGRKDWPHSETGWIAYRVSHPVPRALISTLVSVYNTGDVFALPEWHDAYVWDRAREKFHHWQDFFVNLSEGIGGTHVWPHTILGEYTEHFKGLNK